MAEEIIIDVSNCPRKRDDDCMEVPVCNEYGDLISYQSCEAQTLCPYRSQKKIERLEQLKNKYYQQTLDDEIQIDNLLEEIQQIKQDRNVENITRLSLENKCLEQENKDLQERLAEVQNTYLEARTSAKEALQEDKQMESVLEEIKSIVDKFDYWNSNLPKASEIIDEVRDKINEVLQ